MHSLEFHGFETLNTVVGNGHIIECPDFDTITLFWPSFETVTHLCVPVLLIAVFRIRVFSRIRIRRFFSESGSAKKPNPVRKNLDP